MQYLSGCQRLLKQHSDDDTRSDMLISLKFILRKLAIVCFLGFFIHTA